MGSEGTHPEPVTHPEPAQHPEPVEGPGASTSSARVGRSAGGTHPEPTTPPPEPVEGQRLRLILASQSPARLATLRSAGVEPEVIVSGVDESVVQDTGPAGLALTLAQLKATAVADQLLAGGATGPTLIIGCDSVLEIDGVAYGKPGDPGTAIERWRLIRGRSGILHTGHQLIKIDEGLVTASLGRGAATTVHFADLDDAEIEAYVATGEPLAVAGSFTLDGLGGPFVTGIEGDPHNVVGISLPLLREMIMTIGHRWPELWS